MIVKVKLTAQEVVSILADYARKKFKDLADKEDYLEVNGSFSSDVELTLESKRKPLER